MKLFNKTKRKKSKEKAVVFSNAFLCKQSTTERHTHNGGVVCAVGERWQVPGFNTDGDLVLLKAVGHEASSVVLLAM